MSDLSKIDDVIAYIESPEYLRMTARVQGEDPSSLLQGEREPEPEPEPESPVQWDHDNSRCICASCNLRRIESAMGGPVPLPVRLHIRQDPPEAFTDALAILRPFTTSTNNLRGVRRPEGDCTPTPSTPAPCGRLTDQPTAAALWRADQRVIDYVVYSYDTPIAWHCTGDGWAEWIFPTAHYTSTTDRHQSKIKYALMEGRLHVIDFPPVRIIRDGD